jgi:acyl carrier protein
MQRNSKGSFPSSWKISGDNVVTRDEIRQTLLELFEAETGEPLDVLSDDQHLAEQLGLDSVDMVSLIMQLERHFKIRLTHEELADAMLVGQLLDIVQVKANEIIESGVADVRKIAA